MKQTHILVIEDDPDLNNLIRLNLEDMNYQVTSSQNGAEGLSLALSNKFDLMLLDIALPEVDGISICIQTRSNNIAIPIIMLTAKDSEADRVVGLEVGADDYLTKPFSIRELQARVKAMLRRVEMMVNAALQPHTALSFGDLEINEARRQVFLSDQEIELTGTEFDLLIFLAKQPGIVFNRGQLLEKVWGYNHSGYEHTVNSHINRLRMKLETDPSKPRYVQTVWGVGYKFFANE